MIATETPAPVADPSALPDACDRCGARMVEDQAVAHDARVYTPDLAVRQWRCQNGHSLTFRAPIPLPAPIWLGTCDTCGQALLLRRANMRRHPACGMEHDRRRKRGDPLTFDQEPP